MSGSGFSNDILVAENVDFSGGFPVTGKVVSDGQLLIGADDFPNIRVGSLTSDGSITITPGPGTIQLTTSTTDLHAARYIVSAGGAADGANYTTIASAYAAAVLAGAPATVFIQPGTYTENLTLTDGINLAAFNCDAIGGAVTIVGNCTLNTAGTVSISGIRLQTNGASCVTVGPANVASILNLINCDTNCSNATGITFSSASSSSRINVLRCSGDLGTTGIKIHTMSSPGALRYSFSSFTNTGLSVTPSDNSAGTVFFSFSSSQSVFEITSTGGWSSINSNISFTGLNTTPITHNGSGTGQIYSCLLSAGTASGLSIGASATVVVTQTQIISSNTAITGAGTIQYSGLTFTGSNSTINTTTKIASGTLQGSRNTAPAAGFLGEQLVGTLAGGSATSLTNTTVTNIVTLSLTAGVWDVSCVGTFGGVPTGFTGGIVSISETSATSGTLGNNAAATPYAPTAGSSISITIPSFRIVKTSTSNVYLVMVGFFSGGTLSGFGRISATRVG